MIREHLSKIRLSREKLNELSNQADNPHGGVIGFDGELANKRKARGGACPPKNKHLNINADRNVAVMPMAA